MRGRTSAWFWVAIAAMAVAILLALAPHHPGAPSADVLAILPVVFVGLLVPLSLLSPLAHESAPRLADAPVLPESFQRPPPFPLA